MKALITGAFGQAGWELARSAPPGTRIEALDLPSFDICDPKAERIIIELAPDVIINAAAYTAVDRAESDSELAHAVNAAGAARVARAARQLGARLVHISTDFVFDGKASSPYSPRATPSPIGAYGASKHAGEVQVMEESGGNAVIVRTAWLYSAHGANFVKTMLRLMDERDSLGVVADQVGTPSWARLLAGALWEVAVRPEIEGILHWTDLGVASWYDFALAIQELGLERGLLQKRIPITPLRTEDYPTPAQRPAYSVLDKTRALQELACERLHWRSALAAMLDELPRIRAEEAR